MKTAGAGELLQRRGLGLSLDTPPAGVPAKRPLMLIFLGPVSGEGIKYIAGRCWKLAKLRDRVVLYQYGGHWHRIEPTEKKVTAECRAKATLREKKAA